MEKSIQRKIEKPIYNFRLHITDILNNLCKNSEKKTKEHHPAAHVYPLFERMKKN